MLVHDILDGEEVMRIIDEIFHFASSKGEVKEGFQAKTTDNDVEGANEVHFIQFFGAGDAFCWEL